MIQYQQSVQDKFGQDLFQDQFERDLFLQMRLGKAGQTIKMLKLKEKLMQMSLLQDLLVELVLHYLLWEEELQEQSNHRVCQSSSMWRFLTVKDPSLVKDEWECKDNHDRGMERVDHLSSCETRVWGKSLWRTALLEGWPWIMILILGTSSELELEERSWRTVSVSCHLLSW